MELGNEIGNKLGLILGIKLVLEYAMVGSKLVPELDFDSEVHPIEFGFKLGAVLGIQLGVGTYTKLGPE